MRNDSSERVSGTPLLLLSVWRFLVRTEPVLASGTLALHRESRLGGGVVGADPDPVEQVLSRRSERGWWRSGMAEDAGQVRRPQSASPHLDRSAFAGSRFPAEVITVAVRWDLRYGLSYRPATEPTAPSSRPAGTRSDRPVATPPADHARPHCETKQQVSDATELRAPTRGSRPRRSHPRPWGSTAGSRSYSPAPWPRTPAPRSGRCRSRGAGPARHGPDVVDPAVQTLSYASAAATTSPSSRATSEIQAAEETAQARRQQEEAPKVADEARASFLHDYLSRKGRRRPAPCGPR